MHGDLDATIDTRYRGDGFVTGQLAQLDVDTGSLDWTNAGHPLPLHIRRGKVIGQLACTPTLPWGIGAAAVHPVVATEALEPEDSVLFYTDGVVEARTAKGVDFGLDRLVDIATQKASDQLPPEEIVRHIIRAILEHHKHKLADDATLVIVKWEGPAVVPPRETADPA
jgi:serine phosphatase RsbU (regulator of sigma subunit)